MTSKPLSIDAKPFVPKRTTKQKAIQDEEIRQKTLKSLSDLTILINLSHSCDHCSICKSIIESPNEIISLLYHSPALRTQHTIYHRQVEQIGQDIKKRLGEIVEDLNKQK
jgi:hypothetical protein